MDTRCSWLWCQATTISSHHVPGPEPAESARSGYLINSSSTQKPQTKKSHITSVIRLIKTTKHELSNYTLLDSAFRIVVLSFDWKFPQKGRKDAYIAILPLTITIMLMLLPTTTTMMIIIIIIYFSSLHGSRIWTRAVFTANFIARQLRSPKPSTIWRRA
jgi:hypothetical protein